MRVRFGGLAGLALLVNCGGTVKQQDPGPPPAEFSAGSRLQPVYWEIDGLQLFPSFWDSERQEECSFRPQLESGEVHHCFPVAAAETYAFADENCTSPLIDPASAPGARFAIVRPDDLCSALPRVFALAAAATPSAAFFLANGSCRPLNTVTNSLYYSAKDEIPLSDFVSALEQPEATSRRIGALTAVAEDGATQLLAGWDTRRKEASLPLTGSWRPERQIQPGAVFADAACQQPAVAASCPGTKVSGPGFVSELGDEVTSLHLFNPDTQSCDPWTPPPDTHYFAVGPQIPDSSFEPAREVEVGTGRIRVRYDAGSDGVPILPRPLLHDTERNEDCVIYDLGGGQGRCLPALNGAFGDAQCQTPVCVTSASSPAPASCTGSPDDGSALPVVRGVGALRGGLVFRSENGKCVFSGADGEAVYDVGDPIPLQNFAAASVQGLPR